MSIGDELYLFDHPPTGIEKATAIELGEALYDGISNVLLHRAQIFGPPRLAVPESVLPDPPEGSPGSRPPHRMFGKQKPPDTHTWVAAGSRPRARRRKWLATSGRSLDLARLVG